MRKPLIFLFKILSIALCFSLCVPSYRAYAYSTYAESTVYSVKTMQEAQNAILESLNCHASKMTLNIGKDLDYYKTYELIIPYTRGLGTYETHNFGYVVNGGTWTSLEINVKYYTSTSEEKLLDQAISKALPQWNTGSDYDKIKAVHDFICTNTVYSDRTADLSLGYNYRSAYDAYFYHESVCSGYALLFQKIMDQLDIPCYVYIDENEIAHAWNIVYLDGAWYQVDCTWDDLDKGFCYDYFLKGANLDKHNYTGDLVLSKKDYKK